MLRRIATVVAVVALIAAVSTLVYFNVQETTFKLAPEKSFTLPLGVLMLSAGVAGAIFMFLITLAREGRHALSDWRLQRDKRSEERNVEHRRQARSLTLAGDYQKARTLFAKAAKRRAPDVLDVIDYAGTYIIEGRADEARRMLEEGQKDFGNDPLLLSGLARACSGCGDPAAAISALERALSVYPSSVEILRRLRDLLFTAESWARAVEVQQKIVELTGQDEAERRRLLGAKFEAAMKLEDAEREAALRTLGGTDPDFVPAIIERANALLAADDAKQAYKILDKSARRQAHPAVLAKLEEITPADQSARMIKLYSKMLASTPENETLRLRAASYLLENGRPDEAEKTLEGGDSLSDSYGRHALAGQVHFEQSNGDLAQSAYRQAIACHPPTTGELRCGDCGRRAALWQSRCGHCGAWNSIDSAA
jgi:HemY protein